MTALEMAALEIHKLVALERSPAYQDLRDSIRVAARQALEQLSHAAVCPVGAAKLLDRLVLGHDPERWELLYARDDLDAALVEEAFLAAALEPADSDRPTIPTWKHLCCDGGASQ